MVFFSIPAAHSHQHQQYPSIYPSKSAMGTLPSIQHFSAMGKSTAQHKPTEQNTAPIQVNAAPLQVNRHVEGLSLYMEIEIQPVSL
jgi:hypothetical protein